MTPEKELEERIKSIQKLIDKEDKNPFLRKNTNKD